MNERGAKVLNALAEVNGTREFIRITDEITLVIDHDPIFKDAGILRFANGYEVEFDWSEDARNLFEDIDNADPIELLTILAQKADGK